MSGRLLTYVILLAVGVLAAVLVSQAVAAVLDGLLSGLDAAP